MAGSHGYAALAGQSLLHLQEKTSDFTPVTIVTQLEPLPPRADAKAFTPPGTHNAALFLVLRECLWASTVLPYHSQGQTIEAAPDAKLAA